MYSFRDQIAEATKDKDKPSIEDVIESLRDLDSHIEELVSRNKTSKKVPGKTVPTPSKPP